MEDEHIDALLANELQLHSLRNNVDRKHKERERHVQSTADVRPPWNAVRIASESVDSECSLGATNEHTL